MVRYEKALIKASKKFHLTANLLNSTSTLSVTLEYQKLTQESQKEKFLLNSEH